MPHASGSENGVNVQHVMRLIQEKARGGSNQPPPAPVQPAVHQRARVLSRYCVPEMPAVGSMPPQPPNLRGHLGSFLVRMVRRMLFWHSEQVRGWLRENLAWRDAATQTILEQSAALRSLEGQCAGLESQVQVLSERLRSLEEQPPGSTNEKTPLDWQSLSVVVSNGNGRPPRKSRLRRHLPRLRELGAGSKKRPILDLGCGRGEWLRLLRKEGLCARGVDANQTMVEICTRAGLDVAQADVLDYLRQVPERSYGLVTGFHLFEYLEPGKLVAVIDEIARILAPGGGIVIQAPNPENLFVASYEFYLDPGRHRPVPAKLLEALLGNRGFESLEQAPISGSAAGPGLAKKGAASRFINRHFYGPKEYLLFGRKA